MDHSLNMLWSHAAPRRLTNTHTDRLVIGSRPQLTPISLFCCSVTQKRQLSPTPNHRKRHACRLCACIDLAARWIRGYQSGSEMNMFIWQRGHGTWQDSQHLQTKRQSAPQPIGIQPHSSVIVHFPATIHVMSCFSNPGVPFLRKVIEKHNTIIRDRGMARNKGLSESSGNARRILKNRGKLPFRVMIYSFIETDSRTILHISHKLPTLVDRDSWKNPFLQPRNLKTREHLTSAAIPFPDFSRASAVHSGDITWRLWSV